MQQNRAHLGSRADSCLHDADGQACSAVTLIQTLLLPTLPRLCSPCSLLDSSLTGPPPWSQGPAGRLLGLFGVFHAVGPCVRNPAPKAQTFFPLSNLGVLSSGCTT